MDALKLAGAAVVMLQGCLERRASGSADAPESAGAAVVMLQGYLDRRVSGLAGRR